jgi:uncharacterized protein with PhoU and TrkA domain
VTLEIALVLGILATSLVLFVTEKVRMDVVALLVLAALSLTGLVTPQEALAGFSNPAVITVWAMFMISGGLAATGVAGIVGRWVLKLAGKTEARMVAVIMLTSGILSAFMNNIGVAALLLPVVMDVARRLGRPPSRLLMPLAYGCLLGGLTTLIGTPPNILVSQALEENGLEPFGLFDFTPVGGAVMLGGIAFVALLGRLILPARDIGRESATPDSGSLSRQYAVQERMVVMKLREDSPLAGRTLRACRLGSATGLAVVAIIRKGQTRAAPGPGHKLESGDGLLVEGRLDRLEELRGWRELEFDDEHPGASRIVSDDVRVIELRIPEGSSLAGISLKKADFRGKLGATVLAVRRGEEVFHTALADRPLHVADRLLVQGRQAALEAIESGSDLEVFHAGTPETLTKDYHIDQRIFVVRVPEGSVLEGRSLAESRLGDALGLGVLGIIRGETRQLLPDPAEQLRAGDRLLVRGDADALEVFHGLQQLETDEQAPPPMEMLETVRTGLAEVILSPRTALAGQTLRELDFRERYGVHVLAILREGRAIRSNLQNIPLKFGDALLLFGRHQKLHLVASDREFVVLTRTPEKAKHKGNDADAGHRLPRRRRGLPHDRVALGLPDRRHAAARRRDAADRRGLLACRRDARRRPAARPVGSDRRPVSRDHGRDHDHPHLGPGRADVADRAQDRGRDGRLAVRRNDGGGDRRVGQLHQPDRPPRQRAGDGPGRLPLHRLREAGTAAGAGGARDHDDHAAAGLAVLKARKIPKKGRSR